MSFITRHAQLDFTPAESGSTPRLRLDDAATRKHAFAISVLRGLSAQPRSLSCRYLYDARGSALFDRITELPEYYLTRAEAEILEAQAPRLRTLVGSSALAELGAGSATKTRHLLRAWLDRGPTTYMPIDISAEHLSSVGDHLRRSFQHLDVREFAGTYEQAFPHLRHLSPLCLLFLGSSLGNLDADETDEFFAAVAANLNEGDHLLVGIDLVKGSGALERAYNDAAGVTPEFTLNLFRRMNRDLGTKLDLGSIEHVAYYNDALAQVEIYARFRREQEIALPEYGGCFRIAAGEMVRVEISRKFDAAALATKAGRHGLVRVESFTDRERRFALLLLRRSGEPRSASRSGIRNNLEATRAHTLEIVAPLSDAQLRGQHSHLMSPIVWDLGHIANYEEQWVSRAARAGVRADGNAARNDGTYDAVRHARVRRAELSLLDRAGAIEFLGHTRSHTLAALAQPPRAGGGPLLADDYVFAMIAQHEGQHAETILQAVQLLEPLDYEPFWRRQSPITGRALSAEVVIPAGPFLMGTDDRTRAYDNERPAHAVDLKAYCIDTAPVTNRQFLDFIEDGGYRRPELWSEAGRDWLARCGVEHPQQWRRTASVPDAALASADASPAPVAGDASQGIDGWLETHFGRLEPLLPDRPVVHVCWYEADAYARWAGKRLPTEAEWEKTAAWDLERGVPRLYPWGDSSPSAARANLGQDSFAPAAVGAYPRGASYFGCEQMLGDVWEWTSSEFLPYPGFEVFPYREYSALHFGKGYKVLRGGSWATSPIAIRNSFRNWDLPQRRQIFAGFRCARDA